MINQLEYWQVLNPLRPLSKTLTEWMSLNVIDCQRRCHIPLRSVSVRPCQCQYAQNQTEIYLMEGLVSFC